MSSYRLMHPVTLRFADGQGAAREELLEEVTLRRATAGDLLLFDQHEGRPMALIMAMITALTGLDAAQVRKLDAEDFVRLGELVMPDGGNGPATGATSSASSPPPSGSAPAT